MTPDLESLKVDLHELLPGEPIDVRSSQKNIVLAGQVSSTPKMDAAVQLATSFLPEDGRILNMLQVGGSQQVMLEVKVAEVARIFTRAMGIDFNIFSSRSLQDPFAKRVLNLPFLKY